MRVKVSYMRSNGAPVDVVVTADAATTIGEVAQELLDTDPADLDRSRFSGPVTLQVRLPRGGHDVVLPADRTIGEASIASGCTVAIVPAAASASGERSGSHAATLTVVRGRDAGRRFELPLGGSVIGRDPSVDVVLSDGLVSKRHARVDVGATIELVDLNSANGVFVDDVRVTRVVLTPGQHAQIGDSWITVSPTVAVTAPAERMIGGAEPFLRSARVEARYAGKKHSRPQVPVEPAPPIFNWIMLIAPILLGFSMYLLTNRVMSLLFVAMAPLMMAANFINTRMKNKRQGAAAGARFEEQLAELEATLSAELPREAHVRRAEAPSTAEVYHAAMERGPLLWTRRPEHWSFLGVRLGIASLPSRNTIAPAPDVDEGLPELSQRLRELEERYAMVPDVPVIESLPLAGALGVVGGQHGPDALRGLLMQLTGLHSPAELVLVALTSPEERADVDWLRWLPHTSSPQSPLTGVHLADTQPTISGVIGDLEAIAAARLGSRAAERPLPHGPLADDLRATGMGGQLDGSVLEPGPPHPIVVVVVTEAAPADRGRLVQLGERAAETGIVPIWLAADQDTLPAMCRTFLDVTHGLDAASVHFVRHGAVVAPVATEGITTAQAEAYARAISPLVDAGAVVADSSDLPHQVSLMSLLGEEIVDSGTVVERWRQNASLHDRTIAPQPRARAGSLRALVGQMGVDAMHLDLRGQGPHALVGGTTGAGKSEFLQAWVLGMAAEYSPDRVTFLFVDYKGGAAFADCVRLPHCVGLVTDLSPHLVRRALTSLRAELRHREHLLNRKKAKDLLELERRGDHDAPPALVLVIDEFAALSKEVPEFVEGVVDIAQRGRSLGIHLIMATQRPAGVIKDNIRANTNLRIALRMADESDSTDVIGVPVAAHFDPGLPGRGIAKSGPGRLTPFQSAYAGGHTDASIKPRSTVQVHELRFGSELAWERPEGPQTTVPSLGPTDQVRLVDAIIAGAKAAEVPEPRRPWLEELSNGYDLAKLGPRTDTEIMMGVADLPDEQARKTVSFLPDVDGNLAIYGTGGSGKTVLLRTLTISAGITPRGGPVHVYALDFATGGLRQLEPLPHVAAVVSGDDHERVVRLLRTLQGIAAERTQRFPEVNAGSIVDYRAAAGRPNEPRILLLIDGLPAFRDAYEVAGSRAQWYAALQQLMNEGRQLGIHVVFTADRPGSVPGAIAASVPRRVVMRMADENSYRALGVPADALDGAPPGRAIIDDLETQIAVLGGSSNVADQSKAIVDFAHALSRQSPARAPEVRALPTEYGIDELPSDVNGLPALGLSDETLEPIGFDATGGFLVGGGPGSGRSNAVLALSHAIRRWDPEIVMMYFGIRRSTVPSQLDWALTATTPENIADAAKQLAATLKSGERTRRMAVVIEGLSDLVNTPADGPLLELVKLLKRSEHLVIGESETATWGSIFPLYGEFKSSRHGILLQPDWVEGDSILKTTFPKAQRSEFPVGRGMLARGGRSVKVQLPLASGYTSPLPADETRP